MKESKTCFVAFSKTVINSPKPYGFNTEDNNKIERLIVKIGKYEIKHPIIQGGMGVGISWDQLAGNVSLKK